VDTAKRRAAVRRRLATSSRCAEIDLPRSTMEGSDGDGILCACIRTPATLVHLVAREILGTLDEALSLIFDF
jgi:hypothetical protein